MAQNVTPRVKRFARALRISRAMAGMSQADLAKELGVAPTTISGYETLQRTDTPPPAMVYEMERALGIKDARLAVAAGYLPKELEAQQNEVSHTTDMEVVDYKDVVDREADFHSMLMTTPRMRRSPSAGPRLNLPSNLSEEAISLLQFLANYLARLEDES